MALRVVSWLRHPKATDNGTDLPASSVPKRTATSVLDLHRQPALLPEDVLGLTAPFGAAGLQRPDLLRPRTHLRIVPAKVAGEPHVAHSRITHPDDRRTGRSRLLRGPAR